MKKVIAVVLVLAAISSIAVYAIYDKTHYDCYVFVEGESFDTGMMKGNHWYASGEVLNFTRDQLIDLASQHRVSWQLMNGLGCLGITIADGYAIVVPELRPQDIGITHGYLTF